MSCPVESWLGGGIGFEPRSHGIYFFLWAKWDYNDMKEVKDGSFCIDSLETHFQPLGDPPRSWVS